MGIIQHCNSDFYLFYILVYICYLHSALPFSSRKGGLIISHPAAWFSFPRLLRIAGIPVPGMPSDSPEEQSCSLSLCLEQMQVWEIP